MNQCVRRVLGIVLACVVLTTVATGATEDQKLNAINQGLANLAATQLPNGSWAFAGYEQAATGAAVMAFLSQKDKWGANTAAYQVVVDNAMAYLLATATLTTVSTRLDAVNICPGGSGSCPGVYWYGSGETTYTTGLVAPAIALYGFGHAGDVATASGPLAGMTWGQIAQGITNLFASSQTTAAAGIVRGGWRYWPNEQDSDMSTTQWAIISLVYDQTLGAVTPQIVKDELKFFLAVAQDPVSGGGCYQPGAWCDHSDTGGLLVGLKFVGYDLSNAQVQSALGFLNTNWSQAANGTWFGNFGHPYAMWSAYKGLEVHVGLTDTTHILNLSSTCGAPDNLPGNPAGSLACNWWQDYNHYLVNNQAPDGSWAGYAYWYGPLSTAFAVSILGATPIPVGNPVLDDFNRANGGIGSNWTGTTSGFLIWNQQAWPKVGGQIYWSPNAFGTSQEAFVTLTKIDQYSQDTDVMLKVQKGPYGTISYKRGMIRVAYFHKMRRVEVATLLPGSSWVSYPTTIPVTFNPGDKLGAKVFANGEVHILQNGVELGTIVLNAKDQAFFNVRGGYIGLWFMSDPGGFFDDFGGGSL